MTSERGERGLPHDFSALIEAFRQTDAALAAQAAKAVNIGLTLRNWCFGCYLTEFEQNGADRADYGARLVEEVSARLTEAGVAGIAPRSLRLCRQFYLAYPGFRQTPSAKSLSAVLPVPIRQTLSATSSGFVAGRTALPDAPAQAPAHLLLERLSFSHFAELLQLDDALQRTFYETETLHGRWSVRELKRQIATQYYQRSGLSANKAALSKMTQSDVEQSTPRQVIRDPYVFEFLGLKPHEVVTEGQLEDALLEKLQAFLLELGHGFCFEARQKRLLIGGEHFFVDLVFYHRVLKCHVLIELKNDAFRHEHLGQFNSHVSYYRQHEMSDGDQPPIGLLLCTRKNAEMVEYALAGMSNQLFVSRYQVQLPDKEDITAFLHDALKELGDGDA